MAQDTFKFDITAKKSRFTREQLLENLRAFDQSREECQRGATFTMREFDRWPGRKFGARIARERYGAWRHAMAAAGMRGRCRGEYTNEELMDLLEQTWRKLESRPGIKALTQHTSVCGETFARRFGSVTNACRRLALYKEGKISREQLLLTVPKRVRRGSKKLRWKILERDGHKCTVCGMRAEDGVKLEVDHIRAFSKGGKTVAKNLRTLCRDCNRGKAAA